MVVVPLVESVTAVEVVLAVELVTQMYEELVELVPLLNVILVDASAQH